MVVPHGGQTGYFGTNPIAIAFPRQGAPLCLDMATSQVAWNKVVNARVERRALPSGLAVDAEGRSTTDAQEARALIPLGGPEYGYKGYGLAMMVDLLSGALNGMGFGRHISGMYDNLDAPQKIGHLVIAIDPRRFAGGATLEATVRALTDDVVHAGAAVQVPGDPELRAERERRATGIPIEAGALADMQAWSARLDVDFPSAS
jgi:ureidoglycolate dehydrogenase (NAD+)